ncbi:MAG TPA: SDR family oxidoreductase [Methylomirabilota bacterium]|nr:SDR family oxidoreductase [Methylomirabilota bacterium]
MTTAWITGAGGLIGSQIVREAPANWTARGLTRADFDLTDFAVMRAAFERDRPQFVIHCAALSKTLECERNPEHARLNNIEVTRVLAELAADIPLLFFSTDLVFDGAKGNYSENDAPNPLTVYAETKLAAERIVLANPKHTVIRTSLNAGRTTRANAFNEQWRADWLRGGTTNLFADEFRSPIAAKVTARAVWELVAANQPGLYHLGGSERLSRYEIGQLLAANEPHLNARIERGSIRDYTNMRRSPDTSLDSSKIQRLLSFQLPKFSDWLRDNASALIP